MAGSLPLDDLPVRSECATRRVAAIGSRFASSARWATRPGARNCGGWRRSQASPRPTGRRSLAPWAVPPSRVGCDNDPGLANAVRARFPDAELYLCACLLYTSDAADDLL